MVHQGSIENPNYHNEFDTDVDDGPGPVEQQRDFSEPRQWEIPSVSLLGDLGSGHFGKVMKAQLKTREGITIVAVKMLKRRCHILFLYSFFFSLLNPPPHPRSQGLFPNPDPAAFSLLAGERGCHDVTKEYCF